MPGMGIIEMMGLPNDVVDRLVARLDDEAASVGDAAAVKRFYGSLDEEAEIRGRIRTGNLAGYRIA